MAWLFILAGLVVLLLGAEFLVRGAAWLAEAFGVRPMIVGLTVVAIGTSAPELVVSLQFANQGLFGDALGNVYGSNIANIALILGSTALVMPIVMTEGARIRFELLFLVAASSITLIPLFTGNYSRALGITMIVGLALFIWILVERERRGREPRGLRPTKERSSSQFLVHGLMIPVGLTGLVFGGRWLVEGATEIAKDFGLSEGVIGATVVAIGTSLPELATSIVAARKGHSEMALGNVIGSNIFNLLMVLGCSATLYQLPVGDAQMTRTLIGLGLTVIMAALLLGPKTVNRVAGGCLVAIYIAYLTLEVMI